MNTKYNEKENNILEEDSDLEEGEEEEKDVVMDLENEDEDDDIEEEDGEMDMDYLETRENENDRQNTSKIIEDEYSEGDDVETEDDDSVEEEDVDENYLQKFNDNINTKMLENMHPEIKSVNYDEMISLARVIRDKNGKLIQGSNYFAVDFTMDYQKNLPDLLHKAYYKYKGKAMIWNREQYIIIKTKENEILKRSQFPGTWDIAHLKNGNQLPPPPHQLEIFI